MRAPSLVCLAVALAASLAPEARAAEVLVAAQPIRPGTVIAAGHLAQAPGEPGLGALTDAQAAIGLEARVALARGQAVRIEDLGPPTLVRRNEIVSFVLRRGGLSLVTDARALDAGPAGTTVRVMNLDSRRTVFGVVAGPGLVEAKQ